MTLLHALVYVLVAVAGAAVVLTRDVRAQIVVASFYGIVLAVLFVLLQAPDVALSQITVGTVLFPLLVLFAIAKVRAG